MESATRLCVAIVDDDESLCRSLGRLLRAAHFETVTYPSAEAFLANAQRLNFDCFMFDIQLGGMSGIELQKKLVAEGCRTPVIFITAHDDPAARTEAEREGCAGFFRKTEPGADIIDAIRIAAGVSLAARK